MTRFMKRGQKERRFFSPWGIPRNKGGLPVVPLRGPHQRELFRYFLGYRDEEYMTGDNVLF